MFLNNDYYVYIYIDPRNFEEFYYGKGKGSRKFAHLECNDTSEKSLRIKAITESGLAPIIKVIATDLTEHEAFLIESTLIWKLGKFTTNIASGHFQNKFRPSNTFHKDIPRFDYQNGFFYYNVGEGDTRNWDDFKNFGFISAGQGIRWRDSILGFNKGDCFVAYLKGHGYVGIGRIIEPARAINEVLISGQQISSLNLVNKNMYNNSDDYEKSEYVCLVEWIITLNREDAIWQSKHGLYTTTHVRASLENQNFTVEYLEKKLNIDIQKLIK